MKAPSKAEPKTFAIKAGRADFMERVHHTLYREAWDGLAIFLMLASRDDMPLSDLRLSGGVTGRCLSRAVVQLYGVEAFGWH